VRVRLVAAALATALIGALAPAVATAGEGPRTQGPSPFIIGGGGVSSAPWAAAVFSNGQFTCSGAIIAPRWVLTARHCFSGSMSVRVGSVNRTSGGAVRAVTQGFGRYDLVLMRLERSVSTSYMPLSESYPPLSSTNTIYGWGMTCNSGCDASETLKRASVRVYSTNYTDAHGGRAIASYAVTGNAWRGDSGGPQVYNGEQVGVASTADGNAWQFYSSVAFNRGWITAVSGV
jgi:secreted trypsin-like serine protease